MCYEKSQSEHGISLGCLFDKFHQFTYTLYPNFVYQICNVILRPVRIDEAHDLVSSEEFNFLAFNAYNKY